MCDDWTMMEFNKLGDSIPKVPCVYFLFNDIELVYVGQTKNLNQRIQNHNCVINPNFYVGDKKIGDDIFNCVYHLRVDDAVERRKVEKMYYDMYEPKLNWNYYVGRVPLVDGSFVPIQNLMREIEEIKERSKNPEVIV